MLPQSLEHAAIHQQPFAAPFDEVSRPGDAFSGTQEGEAQLGAQADALIAGASSASRKKTRKPDQPPAALPTASPNRSWSICGNENRMICRSSGIASMMTRRNEAPV